MLKKDDQEELVDFSRIGGNGIQNDNKQVRMDFRNWMLFCYKIYSKEFIIEPLVLFKTYFLLDLDQCIF